MLPTTFGPAINYLEVFSEKSTNTWIKHKTYKKYQNEMMLSFVIKI
jgi:hypothetical protein